MLAEIDLTTRVEFPHAELPQAEPCVLVIFGVSGDPTRRKLIPALFHLAEAGCLAPELKIIGISRCWPAMATIGARSPITSAPARADSP
jgi:glucose-6-phosphate 1-dehydrogenase